MKVHKYKEKEEMFADFRGNVADTLICYYCDTFKGFHKNNVYCTMCDLSHMKPQFLICSIIG